MKQEHKQTEELYKGGIQYECMCECVCMHVCAHLY